MLRPLFIFLGLWALLAALLSTRHHWSPGGAWKLGKAIGLSFLAASVAFAILASLVFFF